MPSFTTLTFSVTLWLTTYYLSKGMNVYLATYFWRLSTGDVFNLLVATMVGSICATFVWPSLSRLLGKRASCIIAALGFGIIWLVFPVAKIAGLFPAHDSVLYAPLILAVTTPVNPTGGRVPHRLRLDDGRHRGRVRT